MAKLTKTIKRELNIKCLFGRYRGNPIIMEVQPSETLLFRIKGTQQRCSISLTSCYIMAVNAEINREYNESMREYKKLKAQGKRPKLPTKPQMFLNPKMF